LYLDLVVTAGKNLLLFSLGISAAFTNYRVKLTGFEGTVTPEYLTQRFGLNFYYVDCKNDRVGYVVKIKAMKYAKQLMTKWHNKDIDGQKIKCQLELNPRPNRVRSLAASVDEQPRHHRPRSRPRDARSLHSSQGTSDLDDTDNIMSMSFDNREADRDRRICGNALNSITQTVSKIHLHHASSSESHITLIDKKCKFLFLRS
jgi:hypothetical protein